MTLDKRSMSQRKAVREDRPMTEVDAFLTNCRLADGRLVDIGIAGGKIAAVGEGAAASSNSAPELNIAGDLVLPGLVDGQDRKSTRLNSSHSGESRMPSSA